MDNHWEQVTKAASYSPRDPTNSELYQIVFNCHEQLESEWELLFQESYGYFRKEVRDSFHKYLDCGIVWRGCMRAECEDCNHSVLIAHSCKQRSLCPSCSAKRGVILAEHIKSNVLKDEAVRHIVFSIPKRLRCLFLKGRKNLNLLFESAWKTVEELCHLKSPYSHPSAILSLQTSGEALNWNPHIHGVLLDGYYTQDDVFVEFDDFTESELEELSDSFAEKLLKRLVKLEIVEESAAESVLSQNHTGFSVWIGDRIDSENEERAKFLIRYIERAPISLKKLSIEEDVVTVHSDNEYIPDTVCTPVEFLAKLSLQIPRPSECTLRYYGKFSYRSRGEQAKEGKQTQEVELAEEEGLFAVVPDSPPKRRPSATWAECIRVTYEIDPLLCPKCGGQMHLKAAIRDESEIRRLAVHLGDYQPFHPPPRFRTQLDDVVYNDLEYLECA